MIGPPPERTPPKPDKNITAKGYYPALGKKEIIEALRWLGPVGRAPSKPFSSTADYIDGQICEVMTQDVDGDLRKQASAASYIARLQELYKSETGEFWTRETSPYYKAMMSPSRPTRDTWRKRGTPHTTSWEHNRPDTLDRIKALLLRFIDWLNGVSGAAEDDKHMPDGEEMATLAELFEGGE